MHLLRLQIKYLATHPDGETSSLALPVPRTSFQANKLAMEAARAFIETKQ